MGLLDELLGTVLSGHSGDVSQEQGSGIAQAVVGMLNDPRLGGIDGLLRQFQQSGLGDVFQSWIGTGKNLPVSAQQLSQVLGHGQMEQLTQQAGVSASQGVAVLAQILPMVIDRLTPDGKVPQQSQLVDAGMNLLKRLLA